MKKKLLLTLAVMVLLLQLTLATNVLCYHGTSSYSRPGNGQFNISNVPTNLCTHYIYSFLGLDDTSYTIKLLDEYFDIELNGLANAVALRENNPELKVIASIGGWGEGSGKYSDMVSSTNLRTNFIQSALDFVETYGFDGLDIDWEYPGVRDGSRPSTDKENFILLLEEWYSVFNPRGYILTAAVDGIPSNYDISYNATALSLYLDSINVMSYDLHWITDNFTGFNSPLYASLADLGTDYEDHNVNASLRGWIERGADPAKLAVGVPFYGKTYVLVDPSNTTPGAPDLGIGGPPGPYVQQSGSLGYNEVVEEFATANDWTKVWDETSQVPYAYRNTTWLSYDNEESIAKKVKFALSLGAGGVCIWSIDLDDRVGTSGRTFPLLNAINDAIESKSPN